jgi:hypothetical protein
MRDLEQVHMGQIVLEKRRVDALLDVAHEQDPTLPDPAEQDDRDVVDAGTAIGRGRGHLAADRPQDSKVDLVDRQAVARGQCRPNG